MATKVTMPRLGVTMTSGKVTKWLKKEGETVQKGDGLFEVETEKLQTVIKSPIDGVLGKIVASAGTTVAVAGLIALLTVPGEQITEEAVGGPVATVTEEKTRLEKPDAQEETAEGRERVSPLARKLAQKHGIDISRIKGTGPGGRIVKEDILREVEKPTGEVELVRVAEVREMTVQRKVIAERLSQSQMTAVHVTITTSVDMTQMINLRERLIPEIESATGTKLSYTDMITKVVASALREHPMLNSSLDVDKIKLYADINIGVAVALEDALIVPVIRNADRKSLAEISSFLREKVEKARVGDLGVDDVTGGTFTLSNLGIYDVEVFTPIINPPQCALLGIGKIIPKPWVVNQQVAIRPIAVFSLSFDHRIVDGSKAASFLQRIKVLCEKPEILSR